MLENKRFYLGGHRNMGESEDRGPNLFHQELQMWTESVMLSELVWVRCCLLERKRDFWKYRTYTAESTWIDKKVTIERNWSLFSRSVCHKNNKINEKNKTSVKNGVLFNFRALLWVQKRCLYFHENLRNAFITARSESKKWWTDSFGVACGKAELRFFQTTHFLYFSDAARKFH